MALLFRQNSPLYGVWQLDESAHALLSLLSTPEDYLPTLQTLSTEQRRCEWLACRVLLKELLGHEAPVAYHPNGAPYLPDYPLHISLSHTKGYVAVLVQELPGAGIDIEVRSERIHHIRSRFMSQEEEAALHPAHLTEQLLLHWSAKETLFKMIGQEGVDFRRHLHIHPFPYAEAGSITVSETRTPQGTTYCLGYHVHPHFVLTWSSAEERSNPSHPCSINQGVK